MNILALTTLPSTAAQIPSAVASTNPSFHAIMQRLKPPPDAAAKRSEAEEAAAGLVSTALILPILKQIRHSDFTSKGPFSPGTGEKAFGPEFDMQIADRIAHSPQLGIRKALADRMMKRGSVKKVAVTLTHKDVDVHG